MSKLRIMHAVLRPRASGAEALVASLLLESRQAAEGCLLGMLAMEGGFAARMEELRQAGVPTYTPGADLRGWERIVHIQKACAEFQPDVIFAHSVIPAAYVRAAVLLRARPSVISVLHDAGEDDYANWRFRLPEKILRHRSAGLIAVSPAGLANYQRRFGRRGPQALIKNGVQLEKFAFSTVERKRLRRELGCGSDTVMLLHVGRISPFKRQHLVIEMLARLAAEGVPCLCLFAGVPEHDQYRQQLDELVSRHGLESRVKWLGSRSDVASLLSAADVYVMPSLKEAQPVAVVEALQSGIPCVLSDIAAFEPFSDMENVWCTDPENIEEFAALTAQACRRPKTVRDLSSYSSADCASRYLSMAQGVSE